MPLLLLLHVPKDEADAGMAARTMYHQAALKLTPRASHSRRAQGRLPSITAVRSVRRSARREPAPKGELLIERRLWMSEWNARVSEHGGSSTRTTCTAFPVRDSTNLTKPGRRRDLA
jgi:hypothetical protein